MKNSLNIHQTLKTFQKILEHGKKQGNEYRLNGITASTDFDGYTVFLSDEKVTLSIFFHNKYDLASSNKIDEMAFFDKLRNIETKQYAS